MKTCYILIIITKLFFMYMLNSTTAQRCSPKICRRVVNASVFWDDISVMYPFRLNNQRSKSCGVTGYDLYCDNTLGTLIQLPHNVVLRVDYIDYYNELIKLSDPYNCLPWKLMSLNLTSTPFRARYTQEFWLYNCSGDAYFSSYERIDCLSGTNYTVISSWYNISESVDSNCSFLKILSFPQAYYSRYLYLSDRSIIDLSWSGFPTQKKYSNINGLLIISGIFGGVVTMLLILFCYYQYYKGRNAQVTSTTTSATSAVNVVVGGLDQVTIDSYPLTVLSENGGLLKSEDNTCSICISEYVPRETVRMLPECLHRFHKECIDLWLRSKGVCPICRTSLTTSLCYNL